MMQIQDFAVYTAHRKWKFHFSFSFSSSHNIIHTDKYYNYRYQSMNKRIMHQSHYIICIQAIISIRSGNNNTCCLSGDVSYLMTSITK